MSSTNIKTFNKVIDMIADTTLTAGNICETLGYHEAGDGGGARYTVVVPEDGEVANGGSVITLAATGANNENLVARFMDEGKPVNVLQFGAKNTYKYFNDRNILPRNDSTAIQAAIDYTNEKLFANVGSYNTENVMRIVIPGGHYFIQDQIWMPPYMQMQLDGNVLFDSFVDARNEELYRYDAETNEFIKIEDIKDDNGEIVRTADSQIFEEKEVFARTNDFCGKDRHSTYDDEYYVFKKGTLKICHDFENKSLDIKDGNGNVVGTVNYNSIRSPFIRSEIDYNSDGEAVGIAFHKHRTVEGASTEREVFCGTGKLTIMNKTYVNKSKNEKKRPCYQCGIEIGSTEEYAGMKKYDTETFPNISTNSLATPYKHFGYNNLRFSNLVINNFFIGFLSNAHSFYTNVFKDTEFFDNTIAFQHGVYSENELISEENVTPSIGILGLTSVDCGEMNHFRDCLFTGNDIDVNILLSAFSATFTSCHFDFDSCIFRASYRTNLVVDKCHIEGVGKRLRDKYFPLGTVVTEEMTNRFNNRATENYLDEFVGILYAKPITKFKLSGSGNPVQLDQYSYVDLNITSSRIVDNNYLPWSMFSFYNKGEATTSDGHQRSHVYLNNNTYTYGNGYPLCYFVTEKDGILHSPFLLSEFPEVEYSGSDVWTEEKAIQNIPVICRDSNEWASFIDNNKPRRTHRFLSNRTLALKNPYFQNLAYDDNGKISGISDGNDNDYDYGSDVILDTDNANPFCKYDTNAKVLKIKDILRVTGSNNVQTQDDSSTPTVITIGFDNDMIDCKQFDTISAALVTDIVTYSTTHTRDKNNMLVAKDTPNVHQIVFVEYDNESNVLGKYKYDVEYKVDDSNEIIFMFSNVATTSCKHTVVNKMADKIMIQVDFNRAIIEYPEADAYGDSYTSLYALLVEKNK